MVAGDVSKALRAVATVERAKAGRWFFKTGIGEYGEGDQFLGVTVPDQRKIAKQFKDLPLTEIEKLITSSWHEERLTGIFILIDQFKRGDDAIKKDRSKSGEASKKHTGGSDQKTESSDAERSCYP